MSPSFNELPWHDAVILSVEIAHRRPGEADEVVLAMLWPGERRARIKFFGCYGLETKLNFGVATAETVRTAMELDDTYELMSIRQQWSRVGVDLSTLKCFSIETSSNARTINVYAQGWSGELAN